MRSGLRAFLSAVAPPALLAILNVFLGRPLQMLVFSLAVRMYPMLPGSALVAVAGGLRGGLAVWAGWRVVARGAGGRGAAAVSGVLLFALDHLVAKGGMFLLLYLLRGNRDFLLAFGGVVVSFVVFAPCPPFSACSVVGWPAG